MKIKCLIEAHGCGLYVDEIYEAFYTNFDETEIIVTTPTHGECFMHVHEYEVVEE